MEHRRLMIARRSTAQTLAALAVAVSAATCSGPEPPIPRPSNGPQRVHDTVVIIHGVGNQAAGYSVPMQERLLLEVAEVHYQEVLWSDLGSLLRRQPPPAEEYRRQVEAWEREMDEAGTRAAARRAPGVDPNALQRDYAAARGFIGPVLLYEYLSPTERERIRDRLREALREAGRRSERIQLVAHSLGSVIAFDVLDAWAAEPGAPRVDLLVTLGSPLAKPPFLGHGGRARVRPSKAAAWVNVYSETDPIASPLAGGYSGMEDLEIENSVFPIEAHSSYWTHADVISLLASRIGGTRAVQP